MPHGLQAPCTAWANSKNSCGPDALAVGVAWSVLPSLPRQDIPSTPAFQLLMRLKQALVEDTRRQQHSRTKLGQLQRELFNIVGAGYCGAGGDPDWQLGQFTSFEVLVGLLQRSAEELQLSTTRGTWASTCQGCSEVVRGASEDIKTLSIGGLLAGRYASNPGPYGAAFNVQDCITALLNGTEGDRAANCAKDSCGGSLVWHLEGMQLPQIVVVELHRVARPECFTISRLVKGVVLPADEWVPEGCEGAFQPERSATERQLAYPDLAEAQQLMIGSQQYELRVVHCGDAVHHVVYFRGQHLHARAPAGWYHYDDLLAGGKVWHLGPELAMWHPPATVGHLIYQQCKSS